MDPRIQRHNQTMQLDPHTAINAMKGISSPAIFDVIRSAETVENAFDVLLDICYPRSRAQKYQRALSCLQQDHFNFIQDYFRAVEVEAKKLALCLRWSKVRLNEKIEEAFSEGLSEATWIEVAKGGLTTTAEIISMVERTEDIILKKPETQNPIPRKTNNPIKSRYDNKKPTECNHHKTNTHSDEECIVQKRIRNKKVFADRTNTATHRQIKNTVLLEPTEKLGTTQLLAKNRRQPGNGPY